MFLIRAIKPVFFAFTGVSFGRTSDELTVDGARSAGKLLLVGSQILLVPLLFFPIESVIGSDFVDGGDVLVRKVVAGR